MKIICETTFKHEHAFALLVLVLLVCLSAGGPVLAAADKPKAASGPPWGKPMTLETGPDNGFLQCAAPVLGPDFRNGNTAQALGNLHGAPNPSATAVLSGHGNSGLICTGNGDHCGATGTIMGYWNERDWRASVETISGQFYILRLLGCDVGADQEGAEFLFELAKVVQRPVVAPTFIVWCGHGQVWLDPKVQCQQATPTMKPKPIPKPTVTIQRADKLKFFISGKQVSIQASKVRATALQISKQQSSSDLLSIDSASAAEIISFIDFSHPFRPGGVPAAIVTAKLS